MNHDARMLQAAAFSLGSSAKEESAHARSQTNTNGVNVGLDVLHRVKNAQTVIDGSSRGIDVQLNILFWVLSFKKQHLRHDSVG